MRALIVILFVPFIVLGQTTRFEREYTYVAGDADSKITARAMALEQVKRILLEEIGVYVHSTIEIRDTEENNGLGTRLNSLTERRTKPLRQVSPRQRS